MIGKEIRSRSPLTYKFARKSVNPIRLPITTNSLRLLFTSVSLAGMLLLPVDVSWSFVRAASVNVWWPTNGAHVTGTQPFKAMVEGVAVEQYEMYWQVDSGQLNSMWNDYHDYPHKEAAVDLSGWTWKGSGPYAINFVAKQGGSVIAEQSVNIYIDNGLPVQQSATNNQQQTTNSQQSSTSSTSVTESSSQTTNVNTVPPANNTLLGLKLYVNPNSSAAAQAQAWRASRTADAAKMDLLAQTATANWLGGWSGDVEQTVRQIVDSAKAQGSAPILVAYNVPGRDCGGYSAGGADSKNAYNSWIGALSRGIGGSQAVVILEPDSLASLDCLSKRDQDIRMDMLSNAISILKSNGNTKVYLDAGHSSWKDAGTIADRLSRAGVSKADGFSVNVSNFNWTGNEVNYGTQISQKIGGKHFVVDTARNGNGPGDTWCNPWGRKIGERTTSQTGNGLVDGYLWLKVPGESDGNCNGGPSAGTWWPDFALSLVP